MLGGIAALACVTAMASLLDDRYNRGYNIEADPSIKRAKKEKNIALFNPRLSKEQEEEMFEEEEAKQDDRRANSINLLLGS